MKSILRELFNGRIYPNEQIVPRRSEYRSVNKKISDEMDYFEKKLSKEDFEKFENLYGLFTDSSSMVEEQSFIYGFKFGILIMAEVFLGRDELGENVNRPIE